MQPQHAVLRFSILVDGGEYEAGELRMNAVEKAVCREVQYSILTKLGTQSSLAACLKIQSFEAAAVWHKRGDGIGFHSGEAQTAKAGQSHVLAGPLEFIRCRR